MPSLRQLQYFAALAASRSFRKAAELCAVSQPTLSAQLSALEERLGVELLERARSPLILTSAGQVLLPLAEGLLRDHQKLKDSAARLRGRPGGVLRLGLPGSIGPHLLPAMLRDLHRSHPDLRVWVREAIPTALPEGLSSGVFDLLVTLLPVRGDDFASLPLCREPLYLALPEDHPLAAAAVLTLADLKDQPVLTLEKGHALHEQVAALCAECGANLLEDFEGTSLDTLRQMAAIGLGLTFLPGLYVGRSLGGDSGLCIRTLGGRALYRTIGLVWRKSCPDERLNLLIAAELRRTLRRDFPEFTVFGD